MAAINSFKFTAPVIPGSQMLLSAEIGKRMGHLIHVAVEASVDGKTIAQGKLIVGAGDLADVPR